MDEKKPAFNPSAGVSDLSGLGSRELALALKKMNSGQKKLLAVKGNAAVRKLLLRDPNSDVQLAVINSPKTTESEVEQLAALASSAEIVLKTISATPRWMKSYRVKLALAKNPKTPLGVATRVLRSLTAHDLKLICKDPHIRKPLIQSAQQLLKTRK